MVRVWKGKAENDNKRGICATTTRLNAFDSMFPWKEFLTVLGKKPSKFS